MTDNTRWLPFEVASNEATFDTEQVYDSYAIGGVDLSSTTDLTCATCLIVKGGIKYVLQQYFIPSQHIERKIKDDKIPYDIWNERGYITICEGSKVSYTDVTEWYMRLQNELEISTIFIGYDPWNSNYWIDEMKSQGYEMIEVRQRSQNDEQPNETTGSRSTRQNNKLQQQSSFKMVLD